MAKERCRTTVWPPPPPSTDKSGPLQCPERSWKGDKFGLGASGGWGGTCTCPDGLVYHVGDTGGCKALACYGGGMPGECIKGGNPGSGVSVNCSMPCDPPPPFGNWVVYVSRAVQYRPNGGQFVFACLSARTPQGARVW